MIEAGIYSAKIVNYGMRKTKAEALSPTIVFEVSNGKGGSLGVVFWQKNFSTDKLVHQVLKELAICGLRSANDFSRLALGPTSNVLDTEKWITIDVGTRQNNKGETVNEVKWIQEGVPASERKDEHAITFEETERLLETIDISAAFDSAFGSLKANQRQEEAPQNPGMF